MKFQTNLCPTFSSIPCFQNWSCEFRKWLGNERLKVYTVTSEKRVKVSSIRLPRYTSVTLLKVHSSSLGEWPDDRKKRWSQHFVKGKNCSISWCLAYKIGQTLRLVGNNDERWSFLGLILIRELNTSWKETNPVDFYTTQRYSCLVRILFSNVFPFH